ncbi:MAG: archaemetzincin family Zn-dependent metalloprotease [Desulfobacterales bacterium]|nr:archaemetzincin family Zn-dependent metalloprotease [Desulfobacterales bacterium]
MNSQLTNNIIISPIGDFDDTLFQRVRKKIEKIFDYKADVVSFLTDISFAFDRNREQYNSTVILEKLAEEIPENAVKILAITRVDLFIPILTHVYGEAQLGGKASIVSIHRMKDELSPLNSEKTFLNRTAKEAVHELGHTFNLRHCNDPACIMHYSRSIKDVDRKSDAFCRYCRILLSDEKKKLLSMQKPFR